MICYRGNLKANPSVSHYTYKRNKWEFQHSYFMDEWWDAKFAASFCSSLGLQHFEFFRVQLNKCQLPKEI